MKIVACVCYKQSFDEKGDDARMLIEMWKQWNFDFNYHLLGR